MITTTQNGHHGIKQDKSPVTGRSGDAALKRYAPTGTKKKGKGEGEMSKHRDK